MTIAKPKKIIAPSWLMQSRCSDGKQKVLQSGLCCPWPRSEPRLGSGRGSGLLGEDLHLELEPQLGRREAHLLPSPSQEDGEGEQHILESSNYLHTCIALFSDSGVRYLNTWRSTSSESFATVVTVVITSVSGESPFSSPAFCKKFFAWEGSDRNI